MWTMCVAECSTACGGREVIATRVNIATFFNLWARGSYTAPVLEIQPKNKIF